MFAPRKDRQSASAMAAVVGLRRTRNSRTGFAARCRGCRGRRCGRWSACRLFVVSWAVKSIQHDAENQGTNDDHNRNSTAAQSSEAQPQHRIGLDGFLRRHGPGGPWSGTRVLGRPAHGGRIRSDFVQSAFGHCCDPFVMTIPARPIGFPVRRVTTQALRRLFQVFEEVAGPINGCLTGAVSPLSGPCRLLNFRWSRRFRLRPIRTAFRTRNACRDRRRPCEQAR